MFNHVRGQLTHRSPAHVVVEAGGVGYDFTVPLSTFERLPADGEVTILVHLHLREDRIQLYGFLTEEERELFRVLINVSGIGPVLALTVLSGTDPESLKQAIVEENVAALTRIKGIGNKTASRMVVELKEVVRRMGVGPQAGRTAAGTALGDAAAALVSLGYARGRAEKAVARAADKLGAKAAVEDLVRQGLKET